MPKKPSGVSGPTVLSGSGAKLQQTQWPTDKAEIESKIVGILRNSLKEPRFTNLRITDVKQNRENDNDFTIVNDDGEADLELTEFAPFEQMSAGGHQAANKGYTREKCVEDLLRSITNKDQHYARNATRAMHLLVYVTDNTLGMQAINAVHLVRAELTNEPPSVFNSVHLMVPFEDDFGPVIQLFPDEGLGPEPIPGETNPNSEIITLDIADAGSAGKKPLLSIPPLIAIVCVIVALSIWNWAF